MKSEAQKTAALNRSLTALRPSAFRLPASAFVFLLASWQLSTVASAQAAPTSSGIASHSSVDGLDCITADYPPLPWTGSAVASAEEEALQVTENSSDLPYNPERGASISADKARIPYRFDQDHPPQFPSSTFHTAALYSLGNTPILLLPTRSFYSLHEHIRERAPPTLG